MNNVIVLGTSHNIQRGIKRNPDFEIYIKTLIEKYGIETIAEEIDQLSIAARIAENSVINYTVIEPTSDERLALGIPSLSEIEFGVFMEFDDHSSEEAKEQLKIRKESSYRAREKEWLNRLNVIVDCPILVICGANHFEPFSALLSENKYDVVRECKCWE